MYRIPAALYCSTSLTYIASPWSLPPRIYKPKGSPKSAWMCSVNHGGAWLEWTDCDPTTHHHQYNAYIYFMYMCLHIPERRRNIQKEWKLQRNQTCNRRTDILIARSVVSVRSSQNHSILFSVATRNFRWRHNNAVVRINIAWVHHFWRVVYRFAVNGIAHDLMVNITIAGELVREPWLDRVWVGVEFGLC